jgi:hypothetical protein
MRGNLVRMMFVATLPIIWTSTASADTLAVTGGFADVSGSPTSPSHTATIELSGERGFVFSAVESTFGGVYLPAVECHVGCAPGSPAGLRLVLSGTDLGGTATLNGVTYGPFGPPNWDAYLEFTGTVILPDTLSPTAVLTAPFTFSGFFFPGSGETTSRYDLYGLGTATIFLSRVALPLPRAGDARAARDRSGRRRGRAEPSNETRGRRTHAAAPQGEARPNLI